MACLAEFVPTGVDVRSADPAKDIVALRFQKADDYVDLLFPRIAIPALFDQILGALRVEAVGASGQPQPGHLAFFQGFDTRREPDGNVRLAVHMRTDDGMRTVAWKMPPKAARDMGNQLVEYSG